MAEPQDKKKHHRKADGTGGQPISKHSTSGHNFNSKIAARVPDGAKRSIDQIAMENGLDFQHACFVVLCALGISATQAYHFCRPQVTYQTANKNAIRWSRKYGKLVAGLNLSDAVESLADVVAVQAMLQSSDWKEKLQAADLMNKSRQRYKEGPDIQVNVLGNLEDLAVRLADRKQKRIEQQEGDDD